MTPDHLIGGAESSGTNRFFLTLPSMAAEKHFE
jgi:hypothetical protein